MNQTDDNTAILSHILHAEFELILEIESFTGTCGPFSPWNGPRVGAARSEHFDDRIRSLFRDRIADVDPEAVLRRLSFAQARAALKKDPCYRTSFTIRSGNGSLRFKEASYYDQDGKFILFFLKDITDSFTQISYHTSQLEMALSDAKKEIDRRNAFLALMNRNLRTPLYSIMGLTKIAQEDAREDAALDSYLHKISMSGTYMRETIDDILDLRRIALHEIEIHPERIYLPDFFQRIRNFAEASAASQGITVQSETDDVEGVSVYVDRHILQQVVMKLFSSIQSLTIKGGRIKIGAKKIFARKNDITFELYVDSSGIMMEREKLKNLYTRFSFPGDNLEDDLEKDLDTIDIEFIILKSYALALGADTILTEAMDSGSTKVSITLNFPMYDTNAAALDLAAEVLAGKKVLVVDDNDINLEVVEKLLHRKGMNVDTAKDGRDALNKYTHPDEAYDLVLMDIVMPVMDGLTASKMIRSSGIPGSETVPIIAMTGNVMHENFKESRNAGMNAHLIKPLDADRLYEVLIEHLKEE